MINRRLDRTQASDKIQDKNTSLWLEYRALLTKLRVSTEEEKFLSERKKHAENVQMMQQTLIDAGESSVHVMTVSELLHRY